jgi:hypothetical protein
VLQYFQSQRAVPTIFAFTQFCCVMVSPLQTRAAEQLLSSEFEQTQKIPQKPARIQFLERIEDFANVLRSTIWQFGQISVCWENLEVATNDDLNLIRQSIADTWEKHSNVKFSGWGSCKELKHSHIRVLLADKDPQVVGGLGKEISRLPRNVVLNVTFKRILKKECAQDARSKCIRGAAIHEFGHVLGFAHEQNRKDSPKWCKDFKSGGNGDWTSAVWDRDSVMNYCSSVGEGPQRWPLRQDLSEIDVLAVQSLYGPPVP